MRASQWYGPPPEDYCPCGSYRRAASCHRAKDGSWIAEAPPPLLRGPRTGYSNPGCYARGSKDCDEQLTREHFITDDVLGAISADGKVVVVEGAAWQEKAERRKTIGRASLSRKMLCRRHNTALSPLDKMAAEFFRHSLEDHLDIFKYLGNDDRGSFPRGFTMVSGPYIELWMLKVLWGAIEAGAIEVGGQPAYRFRLGVTREQLAEILWRGAEWPPGWGLYVLLDHDVDEPAIPKAIRLRPASMGSEILGGYVQIAGFEFLISFETPPVRRIYRPCGITFTRVGFPTNSYKMIAFAWPKIGHSIINVVSQVPPHEDYSVPSSPRAAALHSEVAPGSLRVAPVPSQPRRNYGPSVL
ncbi:Uncharacterised protein [Mycobacteroides abscessus subsp. massiliense]|nr:Uncharacterised protein [Mycobacteroides abscessus subsp. massiliense]SKG29264.1 Uncharacterised protein [Mycobacteroides abscessus subsp. massiliense]SKH69039.1 Uncharacterised protein [Mycobacteroides abscessus subsp. massiliense]SKI50679.1 Uncharacterised protein [Mycobacteroides abscessus subsp. massiliense]